MTNDKNIPPDTLEEGAPIPVTELRQLHAQMQYMQLEIDLLKKTISVLKKDPGIDQTALKNREKALIVDALRDRHSLPLLLGRLSLTKSSYYYQKAVLRREDKYESLSFTILDCFDGMVPYWTIGETPDASLVNGMLDQAIFGLGEGEHPLIHSDRGCHYRWPSWIERMSQAGMKRSMSNKGCSPDNAACEGLFGRIKNEMFYNKNFTGVSIQEFIDILNDYLIWYNEKRIKISLGNMSQGSTGRVLDW